MSETSKSSIFERFVPMLLIVTVALAFLVGVLWQKVNNLEGDSSKVAGANDDNRPATAPQNPTGKLDAEQAKKIPGITDADHYKGSKDANVVMIEYSDLECPFCGRFHPSAQQVLDEYGNKVAWVYRQFPLETIHPKAIPAAIASECVAKVAGNDAYWKYIDLIFTDQTKYVTEEGLKSAAVETGVDISSFNTCYNAKETEKSIRDTMAAATSAGVTGTPATFVVNKKGGAWLVSGAAPFESLKTTIDEALK